MISKARLVMFVFLVMIYLPASVSIIVRLLGDTTVEQFSEKYNTDILDIWTIGSSQFNCKIVSTKTAMDLSNDDSVKVIPNLKLEFYKSNDCCFRQGTGSHYWGLTQITAYPNFDFYSFVNTADDVTIYLLDTGVNVNHKDFGNRALAGFASGDLDSIDHDGHGTRVAGVAAGTIRGSAKRASIISVKVAEDTDTGDLAGLLAGLDYVSKHIANRTDARSVITMSLGVADNGSDIDLEDCIGAIPAVPVAAAGNNNTDACGVFPARCSNVITVAAIDKRTYLLPMSNYGPCVNVLAPGLNIFSAVNTDNTSESMNNGTSLSTGLVSGVIAVLLQQQGQISTDKMLNILIRFSRESQQSSYNDTVRYIATSRCWLGSHTFTEWPGGECPTTITTTTTLPTTTVMSTSTPSDITSAVQLTTANVIPEVLPHVRPTGVPNFSSSGVNTATIVIIVLFVVSFFIGLAILAVWVHPHKVQIQIHRENFDLIVE